MGVSPLQFAVKRNKPELLKLLLTYKANPNLVDSDIYGWSPLDIAIANGKEEIAKLILEYKDSIWSTTLNRSLAVACGLSTKLFENDLQPPKPELIDLLLRNNASPYGNTVNYFRNSFEIAKRQAIEKKR